MQRLHSQPRPFRIVPGHAAPSTGVLGVADTPVRATVSRGTVLLLAAVLLVTTLGLIAAPATAQDEPMEASAALPDPDADGLSGAERVEALIERVRLQQTGMQTMRADFTQRKESDLFLEPEASSGQFWYRAPSSVRWDFLLPDETTVVLADDVMTTWHRDLGTAERMEIGDQADKVTEYLTAPSSLETLERYFQVRVTFPSDETSPYTLELKPAFERVERRIKGMTIRIHRDEFYPVFLRYIEPDGDVTEYSFENVEVNAELAEDRFVLELPDDVEVQEVAFGRRRGDG
ncbi:MAG: outer membrane lipoprotein carrier protein LolA [Acidobacteriota bacterium]